MDKKDKEFAERFKLKADEVSKVKNNLIGFFGVLHKINERLKNKDK